MWIIRVYFYETIYLVDGAALKHNVWFQDLNWIPVSPMSPTQRQVIHQQILPCEVNFAGVKTAAN